MSSENLLEAINTMRERLCRESLLLDGAGFSSLFETVETDLATQRKDGSWEDINYRCDALKDWDLARHLDRLTVLAKAWHHEGSPFFRRQDVLDAVLLGLDYWYDADPVNPNWWWNVIGGPMSLQNCLLHVAEVCGEERIRRAFPSFERLLSNPYNSGQNLIWVAGIRIRHGILAQEPGLVKEGFIWIGREVMVMPREDGIQPDFSFFQHGLFLYSGGYGAGFISDVARLVKIAAGTVYAWPKRKLNLLYSLVLDGTRWMVRGNTFDPGIIGREITRAGHNAGRFYNACASLVSFSGPRQGEFKAVIASQRIGSMVRGNRSFWCSGLMTHHRPSFYASVRLTSDRVLTADMPCCGGEGRLTHHMAEGATFFMKDGDEYRDLYPVWDWQQIPGTTAEQYEAGMDPEGLRRFGEKSFAGGVSDGLDGCSGMDFSRDELSARKAVFFVENTVVCLGAAITSTASVPVRTIINQCHLRGEVLAPESVNPASVGGEGVQVSAGTSLEHDGFVYDLLEGDGVLTTNDLSGAWSECGVGSDEPLRFSVFNLGIEHGVGVKNGRYAYRVSPTGGASVESPVIIENTAALQSVWFEGVQKGMAVCYDAGKVYFSDTLRVAVDRPCALILQVGKTGEMTVTAASPAQETGVLKLSFVEPFVLEVGIPFPSGTAAGSNVNLSLKAQPSGTSSPVHVQGEVGLTQI